MVKAPPVRKKRTLILLQETGGWSRQKRILSHMIKKKKFGGMIVAARAPTKSKIKESLEKQLQKKGANIECFRDLIHDYMSLYDIKKALQKDIKGRGVSYETKSANGYKITKQNQSIKDLVAVNKQMLLLLEKLKLTTEEVAGNLGDMDEL